MGSAKRDMSSPQKRAWIENQKSEAVCAWSRGASAVVRDTILLDGGIMSFSRLLEGGGVGDPDVEDRRVMYALDLKRPFDLNINISHAFTTIQKDTVAPTVVDGALLGNNYQVALYGGAIEDSVAGSYPPAQSIGKYQLYSSGSGTFGGPSWALENLQNNVHRYVRRGTSLNIPSENTAFYIGGLRNGNVTWGEIRDSRRAPYKADVLSNIMIKADMSVAGIIKWENITMRDFPLRYDAASVWLPVGKKGTIAVLGGITNGFDRDNGVASSDKDAIEKLGGIAEKLIKTVSLYDIDAKQWYSQDTTGDVPLPTAGHCAVAVSAEDGKSHHIYIYGGWRGYTTIGTFFDTVYVLSLPSFTWTKVSDGSAGRYSHKCHQVAATKMMVLGGRSPTQGSCVPNFIRVFNLNTLEWESRYDPGNKDDKFIVPKKVTDNIAMTSNDVNEDVQKLIGTPYAGKLTSPFPYERAEAIDPDVTNKPADTDEGKDGDNDKSGGGSSIPKYVPPLLGVLLGLFTLAVILCGILFCIRRKKRSRNDAPTEASTVRRSRQTWNWLAGIYGDEKRNPQYYNNSQDDIDYTAAPLDEHRGFFEPGQKVQGDQASEMHSDLHSVMISPASTATQVRSPPMGATLSESDSKPLYELEDSFSSPAVELPANPLDQISEVCGDEPVRHPQSPTSPVTPTFETPMVRTPGTMMSDADDYMSIGALEKEMGGGPPLPTTQPRQSDEDEGRSKN